MRGRDRGGGCLENAHISCSHKEDSRASGWRMPSALRHQTSPLGVMLPYLSASLPASILPSLSHAWSRGDKRRVSYGHNKSCEEDDINSITLFFVCNFACCPALWRTQIWRTLSVCSWTRKSILSRRKVNIPIVCPLLL
jgi:hypothetical protein